MRRRSKSESTLNAVPREEAIMAGGGKKEGGYG